jgi:hypothetical protein
VVHARSCRERQVHSLSCFASTRRFQKHVTAFTRPRPIQGASARLVTPPRTEEHHSCPRLDAATRLLALPFLPPFLGQRELPRYSIVAGVECLICRSGGRTTAHAFLARRLYPGCVSRLVQLDLEFRLVRGCNTDLETQDAELLTRRPLRERASRLFISRHVRFSLPRPSRQSPQ